MNNDIDTFMEELIRAKLDDIQKYDLNKLSVFLDFISFAFNNWKEKHDRD